MQVHDIMLYKSNVGTDIDIFAACINLQKSGIGKREA